MTDNIEDKITALYKQINDLTSYGKCPLDPDDKRSVEEYLDNLAHEIAERISAPANPLEVVQTYFVVTDRGTASAQDRDVMMVAAQKYISELRPTKYELDCTERKLLCERKDPRFAPSFQEIREAVKDEKRSTESFKSQLTGIRRMMDGKRPYAFDVRLFGSDDREFVEAIAASPELPELPSPELPRLETRYELVDDDDDEDAT